MSSDVQQFTSTGRHRVTCPLCHGASMRRVQRQGFLQKKILPFFGYYPWECSTCRIVKLFKNRGTRRRRRRTEDSI